MSSSTDRIREAIRRVEHNYTTGHMSRGVGVRTVLDAARSFVEGEPIQWCEKHGASSDDEATPMGALACWKALKGLGDSNDCSVVTRWLSRRAAHLLPGDADE